MTCLGSLDPLKHTSQQNQHKKNDRAFTGTAVEVVKDETRRQFRLLFVHFDYSGYQSLFPTCFSVCTSDMVCDSTRNGDNEHRRTNDKDKY